MSQSNYWWKTLFKGHLAPGINEEKVDELTDERFLYFQHERQNEDLQLLQTYPIGTSFDEGNHSF